MKLAVLVGLALQVAPQETCEKLQWTSKVFTCSESVTGLPQSAGKICSKEFESNTVSCSLQSNAQRCTDEPLHLCPSNGLSIRNVRPCNYQESKCCKSLRLCFSTKLYGYFNTWHNSGILFLDVQSIVWFKHTTSAGLFWGKGESSVGPLMRK